MALVLGEGLLIAIQARPCAAGGLVPAPAPVASSSAAGPAAGPAAGTVNGAAVATPAPAPSPPPPGERDTDFPLLPAYELERILPAPLPSNQPSATGVAPSRPIRVGDRIRLQARGINLPSGTSGKSIDIGLPKGDSPLVDQGWDILSRAGSESPEGDRVDLSMTVVPLKPGELTLPALAVIDPGTGKPIARTEPVHMKVESAIRGDDPHPREPVAPLPPEELAFPWWLVAVFGALGLAALCGVGYVAWRWVREWRRARSAPRRPPALSEDEEALAGLLALDGSDASKRGDYKALHHRVSEILKRYIGRRYEFDAPERTTREMLEELSRIRAEGGNSPDGERLEGLFARLDRVKFTDFRPSDAEWLLVVKEARRFVHETRRRPAGPGLAPSPVPAAKRPDPAVTAEGASSPARIDGGP